MSTDPMEEVLTGLQREKWIVATTDEMSRRMGLHRETGRTILSIARICCRKVGKPVDMELVAKAIKYAGDNKQYLK